MSVDGHLRDILRIKKWTWGNRLWQRGLKSIFLRERLRRFFVFSWRSRTVRGVFLYSFITSTLPYRLFNLFINQVRRLLVGWLVNNLWVAHPKNGKWIYLSTPEGDHFKLEPNVHFSPDDKWIIFRANFEGVEDVYAVEIKESEK